MRTGQLVKDRYRLLEEIGSGGGGTVWRAFDEELQRTVAVKRALSPDSEDWAKRVGWLRREGTILARFSHPNVVTVHDIAVEGGEFWLVLEHISASDLAEQGVLQPHRAARLGADLAGALEAVHAEGVVHRDVKPGNVLITDTGTAKLADFGISRVVHGDVTLTESALLTGTPGYMAPEVARGAEPTAESDVFSLGATLFAAVEGVGPFGDSRNPLELLHHAQSGHISAPKNAGALAPVLAALLRVNPAKRPTAAEAKRMLESAAEAEPARAKQPWRWALVAAAVVAVIAGGWLAFRDQPPASTVAGVDVHAADPCSLVDAAELARFGEARLEPEYGNFTRCDVIVRSGASEVDVQVRFADAEAGPPPGRADAISGIDVVRNPPEAEACERTLLVPGARVIVGAEQDGEGPADLCGMADAATATAAGALASGVLPPRAEPAPSSLINVDACALLDGDGLARFPGVDANSPDPGVGGWSCRWESTTSPLALRLLFDRNQPLNADDGRPVRLGDHQGYVEPDDESCAVKVVHREYTGVDGNPMAELVQVIVTGARPQDQLCELATSLAEPTAAGLPKP
ncbi:serine/threonine protein kinase [Saccharopolyspora indica]|uniref:serine/threonine-protein kinase n=1 Tax=Saccharopolyspora indica TaxID=1229659 RepID=UPI0022EB930D|nr:serine/threonine-protein kinase [Saccharopolyspora indica]MDA3647496.1 serine/threonine-protein kinase [Saccharopolyspora indica]